MKANIMEMIQKHVQISLMRFYTKIIRKEKTIRVSNQKIDFLTFQSNRQSQIQTSIIKTVTKMTPFKTWSSCKKNIKSLLLKRMQKTCKSLKSGKINCKQESIRLGPDFNSKILMMTIDSKNILKRS